MRYLLRAFIVLVLLGVIAYLYLANSAWEFRPVEIVEQDDCVRVDGVPGAEDLDLDRLNGVLLVSSSDRAADLMGRVPSGGIYAWNIDPSASGAPRLLTPDDPELRPHGLSFVERGGGNGQLFVVDHRANASGEASHSIRLYEWDGRELSHTQSYADDEFVTDPNDVAGLADGTFYVTNDHGSQGGLERVLEDYLRIGGGSVVYFDGTSYKRVAEGIKYANGVAVDEEMQLVYVASTLTGKIFVFDRDEESGDLSLREEIETATGVDNIDLDRHGNLWVAAHPKLLTFVRHAGDPSRRSPSEILWIAKESGAEPRVRPIWRNLGEQLSGSSVAVPFGARFAVGSVFEPHMLVCKRAF